MLDLDPILEEPVRVGAKGVPVELYGRPLREIGMAGISLFDENMSFPCAIIEREALDRNLSAMQDYVGRAGMLIAPHGKTTMCPQLFDLQLRSGAWGITVANWPQARIALAYGVKRVLIANQLVSTTEIRDMARFLAADDSLEIISLVDSFEQLTRVEAALANCNGMRLPVLLELGFAGGRCGLRDDGSALEVARAIASSAQVSLAGVEGYEGLLVSDNADTDVREVEAYVERLVDLFEVCEKQELFADGQAPILSAGGSAYFDLVARGFASDCTRCRPVLRSGCYLTHDVGFYDRLLKNAEARVVLGQPPRLTPALFVWAQVLSCPEPGLAIVGLGRRDVSDDSQMPRVLGHIRDGATMSVTQGWDFFRMNDQHGYLKAPEDVRIAVGDLVRFGISHPCTTFDRWGWLLEVDGAQRITGAYRSFF